MRDQFVAEFGQDLLEELFANVYDDQKSPNITFGDRRRIDAINQEGRAFIDLGDREITVDWRDGNWDGSEILAYSLGDLPARKFYASVPRFAPDLNKVRNPELAQKIFDLWQKAPWFQEQERKMGYDFHFDPCEKTKNHYRDWAAKKSMIITYETIEVDA